MPVISAVSEAPHGLQGLHGLLAPQGLHGFFAAQGLQGFFAAHGLAAALTRRGIGHFKESPADAAQGLQAPQGLQGFLAAQGLHGLHAFFAAQGLHGLHAAAVSTIAGLAMAGAFKGIDDTANPIATGRTVEDNKRCLKFDMWRLYTGL